jgi:hypothetical protein
VDDERDYLCLTKRYPRLAVTPEFSKVGHSVHLPFAADRYSTWLLAFSVTLICIICCCTDCLELG